MAKLIQKEQLIQREQPNQKESSLEHRHATWLELFFDLIFVVAIAKAAHVLLHVHDGHISIETYVKYCLIMIPLWWAWTGCTLYANRFDCDDVLQRLMSFVQMFFIIVLSANINTDFDSYYRGFLFAYVGIRFTTVLMYLRASSRDSTTRHVSNYLAASFSIGILISLSSLFFDGFIRYFLLYAGIGFDIIMPLLGKNRLKKLPVNSHHLPERFGLLTIILLGESVLSLATSFEALSWTATTVAMATSGFILICGLWWLYFENIEHGIVGKKLAHGHGIIYSHLIIYLALGMIAAMIRFAVIPELSLTDYKLLSAFGLFGFMFSLQFLQFIYYPQKSRGNLIRNAVLFNITFGALLFLAPSISVVIVGAMVLVVAYAMLDHHFSDIEETFL